MLQLPMEGNYTVMVDEIVFLLVLALTSQLASWQGATDWGEGLGLEPGLGAGRSKRNNKQISINLWMEAEFFHKLLVGRTIDLSICTLFLLEEH